VQVPPDLFAGVSELVPREDRVFERPVFQGFGADRFRTALTRACTAAGVPHFSPHDLRHRRISLLHLSGVPWARIGEHVGQRSLRVTADTYSHVLSDERELAYAELLRRSDHRLGQCPAMSLEAGAASVGSVVPAVHPLVLRDSLKLAQRSFDHRFQV